MTTAPRMSPVALILGALLGVVTGFVTQVMLSNNGYAPFSPPVSLPATLVVISGLLVWFGVRLKRALQPDSKREVQALHAVRLLAAARAGQLTGLMFAGFGAGLLAAILGRTVGVAPGVWIPMLLTLVTGLLLLGAGLFAEHACRVPPTDSGDTDPEPDSPGDRLLA